MYTHHQAVVREVVLGGGNVDDGMHEAVRSRCRITMFDLRTRSPLLAEGALSSGSVIMEKEIANFETARNIYRYIYQPL
jgi:hypothetical protein